MTISWLVAYRALLFVAILTALFLISQAVNYRHKLGARPLLLLVFGALLYVSAKFTISFVRGTPAVFFVARLNPLGAGLATAGFVLLVVEYTGIEQPFSGRTAVLLLIEPAVISALVWFDIETLWIPVGPDPATVSGYAWEVTNIALANQLYMTLLLAGSIAFLFWFGTRSASVFKSQVGALVLAGAAPMLGNIAFYLEYVAVNPTPLIFVLSGGIIGWAILRDGFLDLVPISDRAVIDNLDAGVLIIDRDHRLIDSNAFSQQVFGPENMDTAVGRHVDEVFDTHAAIRDLYWSAASSDTKREDVVEFEGRYYRIEVIMLGDPDDQLGHSVIIRDVTDQNLQEQELKRKNDQLEHFVSVISHDIKNPLGVIQGRVDLAREADELEPQLDSIEENVERISEIIDDSLQVVRADDIERTESVNLSAVADRAWRHINASEARLETDCDVSVDADPGRLVQLFENLFSNAIAHGEDVSVVRVGTLTDADGSVQGFFVADDGVGIPAEDREKVREEGYTTSGEGTGLGLSIISEIVAAHGWQLTVTASDSGGARFEIKQAREISETGASSEVAE